MDETYLFVTFNTLASSITLSDFSAALTLPKYSYASRISWKSDTCGVMINDVTGVSLLGGENVSEYLEAIIDGY